MSKIDPYTLMSTDFDGFPPTNKIKPLMRMVLSKYKLSESDSILNEFGAALITLRKSHNIKELDILQHISNAGDTSIDLKKMATISAVYLSKYKIKP